MAALEQVQQLRQQGMQDNQIIQTLQDQGISPKDINDALSQSEVKSAVAPQEEFQQSAQPTSDPNSQQYADPNAQYADPNAQYADPNAQYADPNAQYSPQEETYDQQGYAPGDYYQQGMDMETMREITKQIIETELEKTKSKIDEIIKLKTELKFQIQNMDNRLTKIEDTIESLQSAILNKIGDYGQAVQDISKDLKATQDTFSKLVNPLIDNKRGKPTPKTKKSNKNSSGRPSERGEGFEDYFR